jgi:hypothetical protein
LLIRLRARHRGLAHRSKKEGDWDGPLSRIRKGFGASLIFERLLRPYFVILVRGIAAKKWIANTDKKTISCVNGFRKHFLSDWRLATVGTIGCRRPSQATLR